MIRLLFRLFADLLRLAGAVVALVFSLALGSSNKKRKRGRTSPRPSRKKSEGSFDFLGEPDQPKRSDQPPPPKRRDYVAAGIDVKSCTKCRKPIKSLGYYFGLNGVPTVYCPSCWSKATDPMKSDEKLDAWWASLTTLYDRRQPM
jgi:hypothetical protein